MLNFESAEKSYLEGLNIFEKFNGSNAKIILELNQNIEKCKKTHHKYL